MRFKRGVVLWNMHFMVVDALERIDRVHRETVGRDAVVTSAREGQHSAPNSLHYRGRAIDLRTRDLSGEQQMALMQALQRELGGAWDVVLELSHLHLEYDPD